MNTLTRAHESRREPGYNSADSCRPAPAKPQVTGSFRVSRMVKVPIAQLYLALDRPLV